MLKSSIKIGLAVLLPLILLITAALIYLRPADMSPISLVLTHLAKRDYAWQCSAPLTQKSINASHSIVWTKLQCSGIYPKGLSKKSGKPTGTLTVNIIDSNLTDNKTIVKPVLSTVNASPPYLKNLLKMAQRQPMLIAGINGGYFRTKPLGRDNNCRTRSPSTPMRQASQIGDGLLVIDKHIYSTNCPGSAFSEPGRSTLIQDATTQQWRIEQVKADTVPPNTLNAIGAGPGLIQTVAGKPQIRVTWEGILSTFEFSANTAVILAKDKQGNPHMLLLTVDGIDKVWGMSSIEMANFIYTKIPSLDQVKLVSAMSMDQGNSTTMFVKNADNPIVSVTSQRDWARPIYDGLFIGTS